MSTRHIALAAALLAIVFLAHAAGRFTQIGGAQVAASIAIYILMALLLGPELGWGPLVAHSGTALSVSRQPGRASAPGPTPTPAAAASCPDSR